MRATLGDAGLTVTGINTRVGNEAADELGLSALPGREAEARSAIDEALAYAKAIGAGFVHVLAGKTDAADAARTYRDALDYAAGRGEALGLGILIEPINQRDAPGYHLRSSSQAAEIIAELGRTNIKLLFDCYHTQISEGDLTRRLEKLFSVIGHIQIAAVPSRAEPDEGEVAYDRLLPALDAMGYAGYVGAEYRPRGSVEEGLGWLAQVRRS